MAFSKKTIAVSLVLVGAALSIISVFIYNQVINKNHDEIKKLESSVIEKDEIIKSIWQNSISLENKKDISLTMLLTNQGEQSLVDKFIKEKGISRHANAYPSTYAANSYIQAVEEERRIKRDTERSLRS